MKSLKITLVFAVLIAFTQTIAAATVTKNYTVKEFSKLKVSSAFHVEFIHSNENKVTIEIDDDVAKDVYVGNSGDELTIKLKDSYNNITNTMKAKVYGNSLSQIDISGAVHFESDYTFAEKDIDIETSGASRMNINVNAESLDMEISGASKITVKGSADKQTIEISGASHYNGKDCKSSNISIEASGASKTTVNCTDILDVEASGASHITYVAEPKKINKDTTGASSVEMN